MSNNNAINPKHYKVGTFECIDEMILVFGPEKAYDFCVMNAWKYRNRAPYKGHEEEDMMKADEYLKMALEILDKNNMMQQLEFIREPKVARNRYDY